MLFVNKMNTSEKQELRNKQIELHQKDVVNFFQINKKAVGIFSDTLVLLFTYFAFETLKNILIGRNPDQAPISYWVISTIGLFVITVLVVLYMTNVFPDTDINALPLPPSLLRSIDDKEINILEHHKNAVI